MNLYMMLTDAISSVDTKEGGSSTTSGGTKSNGGGFMGFMNTMKSLKL